MAVMVNWVTVTSPFRARGTYSSTGSSVISTPAAWVLVFRGIPSTFRAIATIAFTWLSPSQSLRSSAEWARAFSRVTPGSIGTSLAIWSTLP